MPKKTCKLLLLLRDALDLGLFAPIVRNLATLPTSASDLVGKWLADLSTTLALPPSACTHTTRNSLSAVPSRLPSIRLLIHALRRGESKSKRRREAEKAGKNGIVNKPCSGFVLHRQWRSKRPGLLSDVKR